MIPMMTTALDIALLRPGDILAVNTHSFWGWFIRLGAWLRGQDSKHDHIVVIYGRDEVGVLRGLEARPGGVGWVNVTRDYDHAYFVANVGQPKTEEQRTFIAENAKLMLGTPYDWSAIVVAGATVIGAARWRAAKVLLDRWQLIVAAYPTDKAPLQVMCASYAVWLTHHAPDPALDYPNQHGASWTTPADWVDWMKKTGFDHVR